MAFISRNRLGPQSCKLRGRSSELPKPGPLARTPEAARGPGVLRPGPDGRRRTPASPPAAPGEGGLPSVSIELGAQLWGPMTWCRGLQGQSWV